MERGIARGIAPGILSGFTRPSSGVQYATWNEMVAGIFGGGEDGGAWLATEEVYTDESGTIAAVTDDTVRHWKDLSGNGYHASTANVANAFTLKSTPTRLTLDKVDDRLTITVPTGGWTGTMIIATYNGTASYGVTIPAGSYAIGGTPSGGYFPCASGDTGGIIGYVIVDRALTDVELSAIKTMFVDVYGATADYGAVTNFSKYWQNRTEITKFPLIDTSSGTNFFEAFRECSGLTSFPLLDVSSVENFQKTWLNCSGLTSFPLLDVSSGEDLSFAWYGCSGLTSFPLLDVSSGTTFLRTWQFCSGLASFPTNCFDAVASGDFRDAFGSTALSETSIDAILVSINTANTSSGTFFQSGGTAPSATGEAAIDALRARSWTVTVTGGY